VKPFHTATQQSKRGSEWRVFLESNICLVDEMREKIEFISWLFEIETGE